MAIKTESIDAYMDLLSTSIDPEKRWTIRRLSGGFRPDSQERMDDIE